MVKSPTASQYTEIIHPLSLTPLKTKRSISIIAGFSRNTKQTTNEKLNLIPVDIQKADKCAKIAKTDEDKGIVYSIGFTFSFETTVPPISIQFLCLPEG